jgi:hypothetical protein
MYLFEMILLCCKEMNVNKPKNKMMGRQLVDKTGRARLQLKGRIFMQNVTDTVTSSKPGKRRRKIRSDFTLANFKKAHIHYKSSGKAILESSHLLLNLFKKTS